MERNNNDLEMGKVRVRLCFSGHQETVIGEMVGFDIHFSGLSATQGFCLINWRYEYGQPAGVEVGSTHKLPLFIKWESVFVIEALEERGGFKELMEWGKNKINR